MNQSAQKPKIHNTMKTHVDKDTFVNTFDQYGRGNDFSRAAREALFEYFEQLGDDLGYAIEFDFLAICCDWSEYESYHDCAKDYFTRDLFDAMIAEEKDDEGVDYNDIFREYFQDNTQVIEFDGGILVAVF